MYRFIFKKVLIVSLITKRLSTAAVLFCICASTGLFAQLTAPSMPSITAPRAPQITGAPSSAQNTGSQVASAKNTPAGSDSAAKTDGVSAAAVSSLSASLQGALFGGQNGLLSGLLGNVPSNTAALGGNRAGTSPETALLLQQILVKLDELEQQQKVFSAGTAADKIPQEENLRKSGRILRFTVNNYSVLDTCRTIYFSDKSKDGSFLLTADRVYLSDSKKRGETFYMLFKKTGVNSYEVATSVTQDYLNEYSFLHQLSRRAAVTASQTGNLITMRINDPDWKLDLLIDAADIRQFE